MSSGGLISRTGEGRLRWRRRFTELRFCLDCRGRGIGLLISVWTSTLSLLKMVRSLVLLIGVSFGFVVFDYCEFLFVQSFFTFCPTCLRT